MRLATLDEITRRGLIESGLPIHYYFEYLTHGATCLRELAFDTLKLVNTIQLPVSETGAVDLPDDFVDGLLRLASETRALEKKGNLDYGVSTRDISDALELYRSYDHTSGIDVKKMVLELKILGNYDEEDQINTIKSRIESIFGKEIFGQRTGKSQ